MIIIDLMTLHGIYVAIQLYNVVKSTTTANDSHK